MTRSRWDMAVFTLMREAPLAGVILKYASWHWLFLLNLPVALLLIAGLAIGAPGSAAPVTAHETSRATGRRP